MPTEEYNHKIALKEIEIETLEKLMVFHSALRDHARLEVVKWVKFVDENWKSQFKLRQEIYDLEQKDKEEELKNKKRKKPYPFLKRKK